MKPSEIIARALARLISGRQAAAATEWEALNREATSLFQQGNYTKATVAAKKALLAAEQALGPGHPDVATSLNNLGMLCYAQEQFIQAESFHLRALTIREKAFGPDHLDVAQSLNNLGISYSWGAARLSETSGCGKLNRNRRYRDDSR